jgi:son of sevenless-like protein
LYHANHLADHRSRDIPPEASDYEISDNQLEGAPRFIFHSSTKSGLDSSAPTSERLEFQGLLDPTSRRVETPEPWVKKLADNGMSYYYWNKMNGQIEWTKPETDMANDQLASHPLTSNHNTLLQANRLRSDSSISNSSVGSRLSTSSDDSDNHPSEKDRFTLLAPPNNNPIPVRRHPPLPQAVRLDSFDAMLTSAERLAQSLQESLTPSPPELLAELSERSRAAIMAVVESQRTGYPPEADPAINSLVYNVVTAVRNLLYISPAPVSIPSNVLPPGAQDWRANLASQPLLKPAQRKVTTTLSKLVLSARATWYDSRSAEPDTPSHIEEDAEELQRAVVAFVLAAERCQNLGLTDEGRSHSRRLHGHFSTANVGLGLVGAGTACSWKGFGFVAHDDGNETPKRVLGTEIVSELTSCLVKVEEQLSSLLFLLQNGGSCESYTVFQLLFIN